MVIFLPIFHVGCAKAASGPTCANSFLDKFLKAPPEAVNINLSTFWLSTNKHFINAECSLSMGYNFPLPLASKSLTSSPPTTKLSLLARQSILFLSNAVSVGLSPTNPTKALTTISQSLLMSSNKPSSPEKNLMFGYCSW